MAKPFRMTFAHRKSNSLATTLVRAGVPLGNISLLTVLGRKSGKPRTTPVTVLVHDGKRHLVAAYVVGDWVRNLPGGRQRHAHTGSPFGNHSGCRAIC